MSLTIERNFKSNLATNHAATMTTNLATNLATALFAMIALVPLNALTFAVASMSMLSSNTAYSATQTSLSGNVTALDSSAIEGVRVELISKDGLTHRATQTSMTGEFSFSPIDFGSYHLVVSKAGYQSADLESQAVNASPIYLNVHLVENATTDPAKNSSPRELVVQVKAKRNLISKAAGSSKVEVNKERITTLPGGDQGSLPKLISTTTPGVVGGPFGQLFIRGNHANIQYQIDGVQLPESTSGSFGDAFSPRNIDHMEIMTGDIPAEFGERTAAVVNIVTKSGPETPSGSAEVKYGSYNTFSPQLNYGGSDTSGRFRYFLTGSYLSTDRGLDTPDPQSYSHQSRGGEKPVHDKATGNDEFARLDYQLDDVNKFSAILFNSGRSYQIPNYPSSFLSTDPFFQPGYTDTFGNQNQTPSNPTFKWTPSNTNDTQNEKNTYAEFVWKRTLSDRAFLQVAPFYKRSDLVVGNDPFNDLASAPGGPNAITGSQATSFAMDHSVDNFGLKSDYSIRVDENHFIKTGFQLQESDGRGSFSLQTDRTQAPANFSINDKGLIEAVYAQDSYSISKSLTLNFGLRYSATQFKSDALTTQDGLLQPRIGLEYLATESTKLHLFYGRMFQPAPFENLRAAFTGVGGGNAAVPYDLKAEKDNYYETGVTQQLGTSHLVALNVYLKDATDMLDDAQLLNTSVAQPYNFKKGYASGIEASVSGNVAANWQYFANYSYEDARGEGLSGGIFAFDPSTSTSGSYQFLDHVQLNTANAGLTYQVDSYWATLTGLYGSGLRTGAHNSVSLPGHTTFDATIGYQFHDEKFWSKWRVALDLTNLLDNPYPININNGFNGSHYAAGRQVFIRLAKEL